MYKAVAKVPTAVVQCIPRKKLLSVGLMFLWEFFSSLFVWELVLGLYLF